MRGDLVYEKLGEIDEELIADALPDGMPLFHLGGDNPPPPKKRPNLRKALVVCACLLLAAILLVGGGVILSEHLPSAVGPGSHGTGPSFVESDPGVSHDETLPDPIPPAEDAPFIFGYTLSTPSTVTGGEEITMELSVTNNGSSFQYVGCISDYAPRAKLIAVVGGETVILQPEHETTSDAVAEHKVEAGQTGKTSVRISIPQDEYLNGAVFDLVLTYREHTRVFRDVLTVQSPSAGKYSGEVSVISDVGTLLNVTLNDGLSQKAMARDLISIFNNSLPVSAEDYREEPANVRFRVGGSVLWYNTDSGRLTNRATKTQSRLTEKQKTTVYSYLKQLRADYGTDENDTDHRFKGSLQTVTEEYTRHVITLSDDLETRMYARRIKSLLNAATGQGRQPTSAKGATYSFRFENTMVWYRSDIDEPHIEDRFTPAEWRLDTDTHTELQCIMETLFAEQLKLGCTFAYEAARLRPGDAYQASVEYNGFHYSLLSFTLKHRETGYEIPFHKLYWLYHSFVIPEDAPAGEYDLVASLWGELGSGVFHSRSTAVTVVGTSAKADYDFDYEILNRKPTYQVGDRLLMAATMTNKGDSISRYGSNAVICAKGKLVTVKDGQTYELPLEQWLIAEDGSQVRTLGKGKQSYMELKLDIPADAVSGSYDLILYFEGHEETYRNVITIVAP